MIIEKLSASLKFTSFSFLTILLGILFSKAIFLIGQSESIVENLSTISISIVLVGILFAKYSSLLQEKNILHYGILFFIGLIVSIMSLNVSMYNSDMLNIEKSISYLNNVGLLFAILSGLFFVLYLIFKKNNNLFSKYAYSIPCLGFLSSSALILFYFKLDMIPSIVMCVALAIIFFVFYLNIKDETGDIDNKNSERKIFWSSLFAILSCIPPI